MITFAERFLEPLSSETVAPGTVWDWAPADPEIPTIYGTGGNTSTRSSTYADERDDRQDDDRPNEGRFH